ncbi:MAG: hypothetical protein E7191_06790 [Erysipelotrichaceae bacterium]|nr:hypothetical protein [Erysipelotrichaceae bacterium]
MEIKNIINELSEFQIKIIKEINEPTYIQTHKMVKPKNPVFFPACIYVGYVSELPDEIDPRFLANLICIEDVPLSDQILVNENMNLYLVPKGTNQFNILNKIADIMIDEAVLTSSMQRILNALYENKGLQSIVDVASEVFENPLFINDTSFKILAMSRDYTFKNQTLEEEKDLGFVHKANLQAMKRDGLISEKLNSTRSIITSKRADVDENWLFSSVKIQGIAVANIAIVDNVRPFRQIDYELLERFTQIVAIEMEKNEFYKENLGVMYSYLLNDLLSEKKINKRNLQQRLDILDWKIYDWFKIIVVTDSKEEMTQEKMDHIPRQMKRIIADCHWVVYKRKLVFFVSRPHKDTLSKEDQEAVRTFLKSNGLIAGVSQSFNSLLDSAYYYKQAFRSADVGAFVRNDDVLFDYNEMISLYASQLLLKRNEINDFTPECIKVIKQHDEEKGTELLPTLESYLQYVGDPVSAALDLNIHRNTLLYRINKIKDLTGIDLDNGDIRFNIQLYFKLLEYLKGKWK